MEDPSSSQVPTPKRHGSPTTPSHIDNISRAHKPHHKRWHLIRNISKREGIKEKLRSYHEDHNKAEESSINGNTKTFKNMYISDDDKFIISSPTLISTTSNRISLPTTPTSTPAPAPFPSPSRSEKTRTPTQRSITPTPTSTEPSRREKLRKPTKRSITPTPTSTDFLASLRENLSADLAATTTPGSTPRMATRREQSPLWSRMPSKQYGAPIIYSHSTSTVRRKPPPIEKNLACTLEELCFGGVKKIKITRDVISNLGVMVQEEILTINIKPGWKKGTKITFEGKGDERPGTLPADITFIIDEKRHHLFKRLGNDLMLGVEIPLVQSLTGCTITVPLLGEGEEMELSFDDTILYPGYEKIIPDQGMPKPKGNGSRGDLRLQFLVEFPEELSDEQRSEFVSILEECS
ncbi:chaperone [Lithospermum erythrorhizon]|uniref:Chaperone n=1 Tax=Lithospermum erythrorhizon TaxID=34254 RepID=A0AAV3NQW6_LITER